LWVPAWEWEILRGFSKVIIGPESAKVGAKQKKTGNGEGGCLA